MSFRSLLNDVKINFKRWTIKSIRNPFVLVFSFIQPIIFLVLFSEVFGQVATRSIAGEASGELSYISFLVPAIIVQVSLVAAATSGIGLVNDIDEGMFDKILVSPMSRFGVFAGKTLAEIVRIAVQIVLIVLLGIGLGASVETGILGILGLVVVGVLFSVWFTAYSNIMAILTKDVETTIISANLIQLPILFVSTAFLPREALPGWIQFISDINPVTYV
jgi:ABC-2 type transporter.